MGRSSGASASAGLSLALWPVAQCGRIAGCVRCGPCLPSLEGGGKHINTPVCKGQKTSMPVVL